MLRVEFNVPGEPRALEAVLRGLVEQNLWQLEVLARRGVRLPRLYRSHVCYARDPPGAKERFRSLARVFRTGWGDCDDLTGIVIAERWFYDRERCEPKVERIKPGLLHAFLQRASGQYEDPSRILRSLGR